MGSSASAGTRPRAEDRRRLALAEVELSSGSLKAVLDRIAASVTELLPSTAGATVLLRDERHDDFSVASTTVPGQDADTVLARLGRPGGATRWIQEVGEAIYVPDLATDPFDTNPIVDEESIRSYAGVPITGEGGVRLGVLYALNRETRQFTEDDRSFLDLLARRAGEAIETAKFVGDAYAAKERSEALAWVANALIAADELPEVFQAVVDGVLASLSAMRVSLVTLDMVAGRVLDVVQGDGAGHGQPHPTYSELMSGLTGWVLREERLAVSEEGEDDHRLSMEQQRARRRDGIGQIIVVPLKYGRQVLGTITVMRGRGEPGFGSEEVDLIIAMAGQAAVAIENVRLIESTRSSLRETEALYSVSQDLTSAEGMDAVLKVVAEGAAAVLPAHCAEIVVTDIERQEIIENYTTCDRAVDTMEFTDIWEGDEGEALRRGAPFRLGGGDGMPPKMVAPLMVHDRRSGTISVFNEIDGDEFSSRQFELFMTLAAHGAAAVESTRLFDEVQRLAVTDELTEVHNRRHLFELAEFEFRQAQRYHRPLAAIMFDLDRFKEINDSYGHAVGDEVLAWFAAKCGTVLREVDVLGRYGGEEFAVLLPETDLKAAAQIAERLRSLVAAEPVHTAQGAINVTISAGVAEITDEMRDVATLIDRADAAMYFAKRTGRNRVEGG